MAEILNQAKLIIWNIFHRISAVDLVDIFIVAFLVYQLLMLIKETRASAVLKGLLILVAAAVLSGLFSLTAINWVIMVIVRNGALVLLILFQPELRKALEQLGRGKWRITSRRTESKEAESSIREITDCLLHLSKRRVGALIVFEQSIGLKDVIETGTELDSRISSSLLENIFEPNTPLHDGAVVIRGNMIKAAACILTLTENKAVSRELGTRHRAALGVTETTDAVSLIVSEETGIISMARDGRITRHLDRPALERILGELYHLKSDSLLTRLAGPKAEKGDHA